MTVRVSVLANADSPDVAILLPGSGYTAWAPLLYWSGRLLAENGWQVRSVEWTIDEAADADPEAFVEAAAHEAFAVAPAPGRRLVVAKSFGCFALPWARRKGVPGVWLTPVLLAEGVRRALRDGTDSDLAIGGDADELWRPEQLAGTKARTITVPGADHGLLVSGGWRASLSVQSAIFDEIEAHLERLAV